MPLNNEEQEFIKQCVGKGWTPIQASICIWTARALDINLDFSELQEIKDDISKFILG